MILQLLQIITLASSFAIVSSFLTSTRGDIVSCQDGNHKRISNSELTNPFAHSRYTLYADQSGGVATAINEEADEDNNNSGGNDDEEDELTPSDPAKTTTQFLAGIWQLIAQGNHMVRGVSGG
jgi:hypothetical protein